MGKMVIAATFRFEGDDLDLDAAIVFHNECVHLAQLRGWETDGTHAEFIVPDDGDPLPSG